MRTEDVVAAFRDRRPAVGCWSVTGSTAVLAAAATGADFLAFDCQHSALAVAEAAALLRGLPGRDRPALVRVPANTAADIGRIADAGAELVIVPMIESTVDAARAVAAVRYPPAGVRSYGPFGVGADRPDELERRVGVLAMIETAAALRELDAICAVPGLTGIYVGPADLSLGLGLPPMRAFDSDQLDDVLERIVGVARGHGLLLGLHARSGAKAAEHGRRGFDFVTVGNEVAMLAGAVAREYAAARVAGPPAGGGTDESQY